MTGRATPSTEWVFATAGRKICVGARVVFRQTMLYKNYGSEKEGNLLNITVGPLNSYSLMGSGVRSGVISLTSL